jgi:hypothetical protein
VTAEYAFKGSQVTRLNVTKLLKSFIEIFKIFSKEPQGTVLQLKRSLMWLAKKQKFIKMLD